jgi:lipoate---protein ligase
MKNDSVWTLIEGAPQSAALNMQRDADLLAGLCESSSPILHFYRWSQPSATYGHFIRPWEWLDLEIADQLGLRLAARPTGGGILFHTGDLAFSLLVPRSHPFFALNPLASYQTINGLILKAIRQFVGQAPLLLPVEPPTETAYSFCMAKPTIYDVMWEGRKVAGAAQRRTRWGLLHQASISLLFPGREFLSIVRSQQVLEAMARTSHYLVNEPQQFAAAQRQLREALIQNFYS